MAYRLVVGVASTQISHRNAPRKQKNQQTIAATVSSRYGGPEPDAQAAHASIRREARRGFQELSTIGFATTVMGTWEILLAVNESGLVNGGLAGLVWSLLWTYAGQTFVVLSLAELSSMAPSVVNPPRLPARHSC